MFSPKLRLMIGGGLIVLSAIWSLFSALGSYVHVHSFVASANKVEGTVIRLVDYSPSVHYAMYGFRDADDNWHRTDLDLDHPTNLKVEDKLPLLYQPDHPNLAVPGTFWALWKKPVVLVSIGLPALIIGLGVLLVAKSQ
jgi:hypothetical protein